MATPGGVGDIVPVSLIASKPEEIGRLGAQARRLDLRSIRSWGTARGQAGAPLFASRPAELAHVPVVQVF